MLRESTINRIQRNWNAPRRHLHTTPKVDGEWADTLLTLKTKIGSGLLVALVGSRGNGKTQLAVELMRHCADKLRTCYYMTAVEFLSRIQATFVRDPRETTVDIIDRLRSKRFLVVDEIGKRSDSPWANNLLFELIDKRYADETDTLLIDNNTANQFVASIGQSLASRVNETGGIIECLWPSFRQ